MRKLLLPVMISMAALLVERPASAQEAWNLDLGYQYQRLSFAPKDTNFPSGVNIAAEFPVTNPWSIVGQFDWSHKDGIVGVENEVNLATLAAGIRWNLPTSRSATPYVHAFFGGMHSQAESKLGGQEVDSGSDTDPMLQFGAGVAFPLGGVWKGLGQVDYRRILQGEDEAGGVNVIRFVVGVRWSPG